MKTLAEINELIDRLNSMTDQEKQALADSIMENPEAREIASRGAFMNGNFPLFIDLRFRDQTTIAP